MMSQLGVPENVAMVLVQCFLRFKGIRFTQDHAGETDLRDEMVDASQLAQEEPELLTILQNLDKEYSYIYQPDFETGVSEKMARESFAKTILETWEANGGSLSSLQHARLQELQHFSTKLSADLDTCKKDLEVSKERSRKLAVEGKAIVERLALEKEIQSILECQERQNGFLSLSDRLRLRTAQYRSIDLRTAVPVDPLVHSNTKDSKLNPDQDKEEQPDDDGTKTPTLTSCNRRDCQSTNAKGTTDGLEEVGERLYDLMFETTSTSGQRTPSSTSSSESEFDVSYAAALKRESLASRKLNG
ncbi:hypothetical protein FANTH_9791 [Fusarium anthophilum]|uniref:Uncharacterized protein n=1 Tax=Fusarium anthophilum TaxID=48485 RepID=A0A8H4Z5F3_9HYPO|nr:hypothetical protein FANTH_9791 [Fusarium anthophilum]